MQGLKDHFTREAEGRPRIWVHDGLRQFETLNGRSVHTHWGVGRRGTPRNGQEPRPAAGRETCKPGAGASGCTDLVTKRVPVWKRKNFTQDPWAGIRVLAVGFIRVVIRRRAASNGDLQRCKWWDRTILPILCG